ncbi:MAG: TonB-dependent receptor [Gammaproteobacteria bacterium]
MLNNTDAGILFSKATVGDLAKQDTGRVSFNTRLSWKAADDVLVYGGIARGFKAGTFNVGYTPIAFPAIPVRPEELTSYEVGLKSSLLENRVTLNGAVFYYDYKDSQAYQFDGQTLASTRVQPRRLGERRGGGNRGAPVQRHVATHGGDLSRRSETERRESAGSHRHGPGAAGHADAHDAALGSGVDRPLTPGPCRSAATLPYRAARTISGSNISMRSTAPPTASRDTRYSMRVLPGRRRMNTGTQPYSPENLGDKVYRTYSFDLAFLNFGTSVYGHPRMIGGTVGYKW